MSSASAALGLTWTLSTSSGYGLYGLQILLQFLRRGGARALVTLAPGHVMLPALSQAKLLPLLQAGQKVEAAIKANPNDILRLDHPVLFAVGNDAVGFPNQDRVRGSYNIGCAAVEHATLSPHGHAVLKYYDTLIAISRWNEAVLKSFGGPPVHLCLQGIDTTLFTPGPSSGLYKDRFLVFSGGKFEFRKAQDIVVAAFKLFQARHPEALLITCWQNTLSPPPAPFLATGHVKTMPERDAQNLLLLDAWLLREGLPAGSFLNLPFIPNMLMPPILRECHAAIFPNRCEGGTNLVAMEAMACGVPTFVAANTGQQDLIDLLGAPALSKAGPTTAPFPETTQDWGETSPEEVFQALENTYTSYQEAQNGAAQRAQRLKEWDWGLQNEKLLKFVFQEG